MKSFGTAPMITDAQIDAVYDVLETLAISSVVLADGRVTDSTAGSIAWLLGSMQDKLRETITILEEVQRQHRDSLNGMVGP
ncbi:hypothetical protein [Phyllobacterium calauticae]|jgi:hypothetical protein|uniref:hypothetical protein n=1 Tax=Phyllobacterium calauticae TaxID=2817027 RepID=UPI001CBB5772|nr:hypothetical protein [Phyllobacterium calauticae]MBZ3693225.1 hypothetical protein [Phyllobacterium calauticae]